MAVYLPASTGVYTFEEDKSAVIATGTTFTVAAVYWARKGGVTPAWYTNTTDYKKRWGGANPNFGAGIDSCLAALSQTTSLLTLRVVNGATYAGMTYFNDLETSPTETYHNGFPTAGLEVDYTTGSPGYFTLVLSAALVTSNVATVSLTDGTTSTDATATFATDSNTTLAALATSIQTTINTFSTAADGYAFVESVSATGTDDERVIVVVLPSDADVYASSAAVTAGTTQPTITIGEDVKLFDVFAIDPGSYASDASTKEGIGTKIASVDTGVKQRVAITFAGALVTGNTVDMDINGTSISTVTFATDSDTTMAAIATAIKAVLTNGDAIVTTVSNGNSNDRVITVVSDVAGPDMLTISNIVIASGATQTTATTSEVLTGVASNGTFVLEVYLRSNLNTPVETFTVSLAQQVDGLGNQQNIAQKINKSGYRSKYIRIYQPSASLALSVVTADSAINWLTGGDDGAAPTSAQIIAGWNTLANRTKYPATVLMDCGYTATNIAQAIDSLAQSRADCVGILSVPSDYQTTDAQDVADYRNYSLNINSSYSCMYAPDLEIEDDNGIYRYVPPCGYVAASLAYTARIKAVWFSNATIGRGKINNIVGVRVDYDKDAQNILAAAQVNYIIDMNAKGIVIRDALTLATETSALSNLSVRLLAIYIETTVADFLDYYVNEPDDVQTWTLITQKINAFMQPIQDNEGVSSFYVQMDSRNNTAEMQGQQIGVCDVIIIPVLPMRKIKLNLTIGPQGVTAKELQVAA